MKNLTAANVLSQAYREVYETISWDTLTDDERNAPYFAVYGEKEPSACSSQWPGAVLLGIVSREFAKTHHEITFSDLLATDRSPLAVAPDTPVEALVQGLNRTGRCGLPVISSEGQLVGIVSREGILDAILHRENFHAPGEVVTPDDARWQVVTQLVSVYDVSPSTELLLDFLEKEHADRTILEDALKQLTTAIGARYGALTVLATNGEIEDFVYTGFSEEQAVRIPHLPMGRGLLGAIGDCGDVMIVPNLAMDLRHVGFPEGHPTMKSRLLAPLRNADSTVGRVYLCDKDNGQPFTTEDAMLVRCFAQVISNIVRRRRDNLARLRAEKEKDSIHQLTQRLLTATTLEEVGRMLADSLREYLEFYAFVYYDYDPTQKLLRPIYLEVDRSTGVARSDRQADIFLPDPTTLLEPLLACSSEVGTGVDLLIMQALYGERSGEYCYVRAPLNLQGELVGLVAVTGGANYLYQPHDLASLQRLLAPTTIAATRIRVDQLIRAASHALEAARTRYRAILRSTPHGLCMLTPEWNIEFANHAFHMMVDPNLATTQDVVGTTFEELFASHSDFESFVREAESQIQKYGSFRRDVALCRRDGSKIHMEISMVHLDLRRPQAGYVATFTDVTQRYEQTEALRRERDFSRMIIDSANVLVFVVDRNGRIRRFNRVCETVTGWRSADVLGKNFIALLVRGDEENASVSSSLDDVLSTLFPTNGELCIVSRSGQRRLLRCRSSAQPDADGQVAFVVCVGEDLTEIRRAAREQRQLEELANDLSRSQSISEMLHEALLRLTELWQSPQGFFWWSHPYSSQFSLEAATAFGTVSDVAFGVLSQPPIDSGTLAKLWRGEVVVSAITSIPDTEFTVADEGEVFMAPPAMLYLPLLVRERLVAIVGLLLLKGQQFAADELDYARRVATVLARVLDRLHSDEATQLLAGAVDQSQEAVVMTDRQWRVHYANPAFERFIGIAGPQLLGLDVRSVLPASDFPPQRFQEFERKLLAGESVLENVRTRYSSGSQCQMRLSISPIRDPSGRIPRFNFVLRDLTRELELEESLQRAQRMEALGYLAGGVAHDFNNLLHIASGYAQMALHFADPSDKVREQLEGIQRVIKRGATLTNQLLTFSRSQVAEPVALDLSRHVAEIMTFVSRIIGEQIIVETSFAPSMPSVLINPSHLEQIVMNLALNARDAMVEGGTLRITTSVEPGPNGQEDPEKSSQWAVLTVADTGIGMSPETIKHIFEPFYSTKGVGRGTGLGLSTVYGIIKQAGGDIEVDSQISKGSTFRIKFPAHAEIPAGENEYPTPPQHNHVEGRQRTTVLLVEDDPDVRALTRLMLLSRGYRVLEAENGRVALEAISRANGDLDIVLSDVIMPEMGGLEFGEACRARWPNLPIVFFSGYAAASQERLAAVSNYFVQKPVDIDELDSKLHVAMIDSRRGAHTSVQRVGCAPCF